MIELLRNRRSIRKYKQIQIEKEKIEVLKEAVLRSPSSKNKQPWEFVFISDNELLEKISESKKHASQFIADAPLAVVVIGDSNRSDVWIEDASIASTILQLTAQSLGLGNCWIQIRNRFTKDGNESEKYMQKILNLEENKNVLSIISIGYPDESPEPTPIENLNFKKISEK